MTVQSTGNENPLLWLMWMSHAQESSKCNTTDAIWLTVYTTYMIWIKNTQHTSIGRLMLITWLTLSSKEWMYTWRESVFRISRAFYRGVLSSYRQRIPDLCLQQSCVIYCHGAFGAPLCCNCAGEDNTQVRELPAWITLEKSKRFWTNASPLLAETEALSFFGVTSALLSFPTWEREELLWGYGNVQSSEMCAQ